MKEKHVFGWGALVIAGAILSQNQGNTQEGFGFKVTTGMAVIFAYAGTRILRS